MLTCTFFIFYFLWLIDFYRDVLPITPSEELLYEPIIDWIQSYVNSSISSGCTNTHTHTHTTLFVGPNHYLCQRVDHSIHASHHPRLIQMHLVTMTNHLAIAVALLQQINRGNRPRINSCQDGDIRL